VRHLASQEGRSKCWWTVHTYGKARATRCKRRRQHQAAMRTSMAEFTAAFSMCSYSVPADQSLYVSTQGSLNHKAESHGITRGCKM